jgi:hypothetical protein
VLTDTKIRSAKTDEKRYRIADSDGFIEISPSGKKYWRFRSNENGKRSCHDLGEYPCVSLQRARELRNQARHPVKEENKPNESLFSHVAEEWMTAHEQKLSNDKEKQNIRSRLNTHILPFIGDTKIAVLTTINILPLLQRLSNAGKHEMSRRVKQIISFTLVLLLNSGFIILVRYSSLRNFVDLVTAWLGIVFVRIVSLCNGGESGIRVKL